MMTTCSDLHEEVVHTGECPACNLSRQLSYMTDERDEALSKLEKAEATVETLTQKLAAAEREVSDRDRQIRAAEAALKLHNETNHLTRL